MTRVSPGSSGEPFPARGLTFSRVGGGTTRGLVSTRVGGTTRGLVSTRVGGTTRGFVSGVDRGGACRASLAIVGRGRDPEVVPRSRSMPTVGRVVRGGACRSSLAIVGRGRGPGVAPP